MLVPRHGFSISMGVQLIRPKLIWFQTTKASRYRDDAFRENKSAASVDKGLAPTRNVVPGKSV